MGLSLDFSMPLVSHHLNKTKENENKQVGAGENGWFSVVELQVI